MKLLIILMFLFTPLLHAKVYYVRVDGNDANSGTSDAPGEALQSLAKAAEYANPGDIVKLGSGTWEERIVTMRSGAKGIPIVWKGNGDKTIIGGFSALHDHIHFKDFVCAELGSVSGIGNFGSDAKNRNKETGFVGNYCLAENITFTRLSGKQSGSAGNAPYYTGPIGVVWRKCRFIGCGTSAALSINGVDCLVEECFFSSENGGDAVYLMGRRNILRGNKWINWNRPPGSKQHTDIFQSFSSNGEISIEHIIEGNLFENCSGCQLGHVEDQARKGNVGDWTFRNNIVYRMGAPFTFYTRDMKFYNNTFVESSTEQGFILLARASKDRGTATNCKIFNNIFYRGGYTPESKSQGFYNFVETAGFPLSGFEADHNLVCGTGKGLSKGALWTKFGANANSLNGIDPLFINSTERDFGLRKNSPAIGAALPLSEKFRLDYKGTKRGLRWDIGAIQAESVSTDLGAPTDYEVVANATSD